LVSIATILKHSIGNFAFVVCLLVNKLVANAYKVGSFYGCMQILL